MISEINDEGRRIDRITEFDPEDFQGCLRILPTGHYYRVIGQWKYPRLSLMLDIRNNAYNYNARLMQDHYSFRISYDKLTKIYLKHHGIKWF